MTPGTRPTWNSAITGTRYTNCGSVCIPSSIGFKHPLDAVAPRRPDAERDRDRDADDDARRSPGRACPSRCPTARRTRSPRCRRTAEQRQRPRAARPRRRRPRHRGTPSTTASPVRRFVQRRERRTGRRDVGKAPRVVPDRVDRPTRRPGPPAARSTPRRCPGSPAGEAPGGRRSRRATTTTTASTTSSALREIVQPKMWTEVEPRRSRSRLAPPVGHPVQHDRHRDDREPGGERLADVQVLGAPSRTSSPRPG